MKEPFPSARCVSSALIIVAILGLGSVAGADDPKSKEPDKKPEGPATASAQTAKPTPLPELNAKIVELCKARIGQRIGDGQCSSLAFAALITAGGQFRFREYPSSGDFVWGAPVCKVEPGNGHAEVEIGEAGKKPNGVKGADVKPGDVIQFRDAIFRGRIGGYVYEKTRPHHTAIIESVTEEPATITVLEQNVEGKDYIVRTVLRLADLSQGWMRVYRPISRFNTLQTK